MTLSANLGKAAPPHEIDVVIDGELVTFQAQRLGTAEIARLSQIVYQKNVGALGAERELLGEEQFQRDLRALRNRYVRGKFSFEAPEFRAFLRSTEGVSHAMMLIFNVDFAGVISLLTSPQKDEVTSLFSVVLNESFPGVTKLAKKSKAEQTAEHGIPDPNAQAPGS